MELPDIKNLKLDRDKIVLIGLGCMFLITASYLLFLASTWVQFQADRNNRMEKINELLDRLPKSQSSGNDGGNQEADGEAQVFRLRDADKEQSPNGANSVRDAASIVLRSLPQQTPPTPHGTD